MLTLTATVVAAVACALVTPGHSARGASTALVGNGSFERVSRGRPTGWTAVRGQRSAVTVRVVSGGAADGRRFARTTITRFTRGGSGWVSATARLASGSRGTTGPQRLELTEQVRTNGRNAVQLGLVARNGRITYRTLGSAARSAEWQTVSLSTEVPAGTVAVRVRHLLTGAGTLDVDAVRLVRVATSSPQPTPPAQPGSETAGGPTANGAGLLSVTFDDGLTTQYRQAAPVLARYHLPATFYLISSLVGRSDAYLTADQARSLQSAGHELGSHTVTHRSLTSLTSAEITAELADSKAALEQQFGPIHSLAYPYGATDSSIAAQAARYYTTARTTTGGVNTPGSYDPLQLRMHYVTAATDAATVRGWADEANRQGVWAILVYHAIDGSGGEAVTPQAFADQMAGVAQSGVRVVTMTKGRALTG